MRATAARKSIEREWRRLTRGGPTLVACSGGADSSALAVAIVAAARTRIVIAHVVHDVRPRAAALSDRDAVEHLASRLGVAYAEAEITPAASTRRRGNLESAARRERYNALVRLAKAHDCTFIATAHHAEDQAETVLMALMRGAGPRGVGGIAARRMLTPSISLIRPMLQLTKDDARAICTASGAPWREDATNADTTRVRAAIRHSILPALEAIRPGGVKRIARSATIVRSASGVVTKDAESVWAIGRKLEAGGRAWNRGELRVEPLVVLGELLRVSSAKLSPGRGGDRMNAAVVRSIVRAIRDARTHARTWTVGGVRVEISARRVLIMRREDER